MGPTLLTTGASAGRASRAFARPAPNPAPTDPTPRAFRSRSRCLNPVVNPTFHCACVSSNLSYNNGATLALSGTQVIAAALLLLPPAELRI